MTARPIDIVVITAARDAVIGGIAAVETMFRHALSLGFDETSASCASRRMGADIVRLRRRERRIDVSVLATIQDECVSETRVSIRMEDPEWRSVPGPACLTRVADMLRTCAQAVMRPIEVQEPREMARHVCAAAIVACSDRPVTRVRLPSPWTPLAIDVGGEDDIHGIPSERMPASIPPQLLRDIDAASPCVLEMAIGHAELGPSVDVMPFASVTASGDGREIHSEVDPILRMRWIRELRERMTDHR